MACIQPPLSFRSLSASLPVQIALSARQNQTGVTPGLWKPPVRRPHKRTPHSPSDFHAPPPPDVGCLPFPVFSSLPPAPCRRRHRCCPPPPARPFIHQGLLVVDHRVHHHIEYGGRQYITLFDASLSSEGFSIVPSCPCHHLNPLPIPAEEAEGPGPHTIYLQDVQAPVPVQGIV